ncbi:MAG: ABC transporter permease [Clostridia bacterium]|nr:ABC transporter permease [Clostridia bacterium]
MKIALTLIKRNIKLFFKDKGMFFTSLITPLILLVLYATFLSNIYRDSFALSFPEGMPIPSDIIDGLVGGQLISSLLAVSCITVAFCSNFLMVQDRANGTVKDLRISPVSANVLSLSYYVATLVSTLLICVTALIICLGYTAMIGWYMSVSDVFLLLLDVIVLVFFGTALSSFINFFLSSQGQISAVGTIISAGYGFICGAYMPISSFSDGLQKVISFLPGTYGTSLFRNHAMGGAIRALKEEGIPDVVIDSIRDAVDCNVYFFGERVEPYVMYVILASSIALLVGGYILLNVFRKKDK